MMKTTLYYDNLLVAQIPNKIKNEGHSWIHHMM